MVKPINKSITLENIEDIEVRLSKELESRYELKCIAFACGLDASLGIKPIWACAINLSF